MFSKKQALKPTQSDGDVEQVLRNGSLTQRAWGREHKESGEEGAHIQHTADTHGAR